MSEYQIAPNKEEAIEQGLTQEEFKNADWERLITGGIGTVTFGMKGNWLILLGLLGELIKWN